jgi:hypothetical protein
MISWRAEVRLELLVAALVITALVVTAFWWFTSPRHPQAAAEEDCRAHYALAQDAADTAEVDLMRSDAGGALSTCGELRRRGQVK